MDIAFADGKMVEVVAGAAAEGGRQERDVTGNMVIPGVIDFQGMSRADMLGKEVTMRAEDHQVLAPFCVSVFSKDVRYDAERTGLGWKLVTTYEGKELALPRTCKMKRPNV